MEKLGNKQTKDRIADMLRKEILSGRIADGEELAQEQLAEMLEVSRMPIREALQTLELEGLLLRLPNRHMQVVGISERTIFDSMRVIAAIESEIAVILIENSIAPSQVSIQDHREFHNWFSQQLDNHYLNQIHKRLLAGYPLYAWEICANIERLTIYHEAIISAIQNKDKIMLNQKIREYYYHLAEMLVAHVKENRHE